VSAVGLCGSDAHWFQEGAIGEAVIDRPLVLGHEFAGRIESGPLTGQRVAADPSIPCLACEHCWEEKPNLCRNLIFAGHGGTDGALRTHIAWPERCLIPLPPALSDAEGALLEPLGIALHAVDLAGIPPARSAGVFGSGPIGLLLIQLLSSIGIDTIVATDPLPHRLQAARAMGATIAIAATPSSSEVAEVLNLTKGRGVEVAFEMAGEEAAVETAVATVRPGGRIVIVGIPSSDRTSFTASTARRKELTISLCRRMLPGDLGRAALVAEAGTVQLAPLITEVYPLSEAEAAFTSLIERRGLKVVVQPLPA
jgi:L-iditol 2-dehydrogenase